MQLDTAKERLRTRLLETRREMTFEDVWERSALIQKGLVNSAVFLRARSIALYSSCQNEVLTDAVFEAARRDEKDVYYPRVFRGRDVMVFLPVRSLDELTPGAFDIREPGAGAEEAIDPGALDLIVLPGVAFDRRGARLGFGKGYYDRALAGCEKPLLLALAYDFQVVEAVPTGPHDVRMDALITETGYLRTKQ
jgi:5-formyltetrahydrofolate cyclo-ligase